MRILKQIGWLLLWPLVAYHVTAYMVEAAICTLRPDPEPEPDPPACNGRK